MDFLDSNIVDFDVIRGMDWFHFYYTSLDYRIHIRLSLRSMVSRLWNGRAVLFLVYLRKSVYHILELRDWSPRGCLYYHLVWAIDSNSECPSLHLDSVVEECPQVYLMNLMASL